ncbi:MAG TPA: hypothetical protein VFW23_14080 [Tepidisphaeraceae bacterium]|nr:hypothetical protein [Tepidisphaeraceae bacterium]
MDGTIWVAPADNPEVHGTSASMSASTGSYMDSSQTWTLSLGSIPAHTLITQSGFNVAVFEQQDDGCGGSCCGGSCGGSCGGGCGGSSGNDTFSFTLSLNGQTVGELSFDQTDAGWTGSDNDGNPGWGGGFGPDSMPIADGGDSEAWSITPNIPADDGYRHYVWTVSGGAVNAGTDVWTDSIQDAYRQTPPQPGIVQFSRDISIAHDQTVYYAIGGTAVHGIQNADGTYTPANADYTGGTPVPGYNDLYSITIPAGLASAQVQFTPIVPYPSLVDPEKSIGVVISADPNPLENVIATDAPGTATEPAGTSYVQHGMNVNTADLPGEMTFDQINNLVNQLNNSTTDARNNIKGQLIDGLLNAPSGSDYSWMMYEWDDWADGPSYVDNAIMDVIHQVWGYGQLSVGSDSNGNPMITLPMPAAPAGAAEVGYLINVWGTAIDYHFGGPGQLQLFHADPMPVSATPPPVYMDVRNPGQSAIIITVMFYDSDGNYLDGQDLTEEIAMNVVRT